jgi:hypothetical protein
MQCADSRGLQPLSHPPKASTGWDSLAPHPLRERLEMLAIAQGVRQPEQLADALLRRRGVAL